MWIEGQLYTAIPQVFYQSPDSVYRGKLELSPRIPVLVIPLTPETIAALFAKASNAHARGFGFGHEENAVNSDGRLRRAMAAIGIRVPAAKPSPRRKVKPKKRRSPTARDIARYGIDEGLPTSTGNRFGVPK